MTGKQRRIAPPPVNPETKPFWDAAANGTLLIKKCSACGEVHYYPRALCPFCSSYKTAPAPFWFIKRMLTHFSVAGGWLPVG